MLGVGGAAGRSECWDGRGLQAAVSAGVGEAAGCTECWGGRGCRL